MNLIESRNAINHKSGVYIFIFPNKKKYVGQTSDYRVRLIQHLNGVQKVDKSIKKYGPENIEVEFEEISEEFFDLIEIGMIQSCDCILPNGYNFETGGNKNKHMHEETKKKLSDIGKRDSKIRSERMIGNTFGKNNKANLGKHYSKETKKIWSEQRKGEGNSMFGKNRTDEWKKQHSEFMKGKQYALGCKRSDEYKKKASESKIGKKNPNFGKHLSRETILKKSKSIFQFSLDNVFIKKWESAVKIQKETGFDRSSIGKVCRGKLPHAYGYIWKYSSLTKSRFLSIL